jgi:serine/threonine protein kinase
MPHRKIFDGECIFRGRNATVFRSISNGLPVVIKTHTKPILTERQRINFKKEYDIGVALSDKHSCIKTLEYIDNIDDEGRQRVAIVMEDGGIDLDTHIPQGGYPTPEFLNIAIQCAQGLQDIHRSNIIHTDIKPANFVRQIISSEFTTIGNGCD